MSLNKKGGLMMICISRLQEYTITPAQMNLLFKSRIIWRDIATWLRAYLVYVFLNSDPELKQAVIDNLNSLPKAFGNVLRIYFGDVAADEYTVLLSNYIKILTSLTDAIKNGDTNAIDEYTNQLYQNINERVNFLSTVNPFWEKNTVSNFINNYTKMTIDEIYTFSNKNYKRNIDLFKGILTYADSMGDYIADGLLKYLTYSSREPRIPE